MAEPFVIERRPDDQADVVMVAGWRQWADAGAVSSGLPLYLIQQTSAEHIATLNPDGYYLFQFPGTHDLVRPIVQFERGFPISLQAHTNEAYMAPDGRLLIFLGEEPHMDVERYVQNFLDLAKSLGVKRIIGMGGVYGETPFDRERNISAMYSLPQMRAEVERYGVSLSDYQGGASIESYICRRAGERGMEFVAFYAFVPAYDFTELVQTSSAVRIENDFASWLGVMRRIRHMFKLDLDLGDLEQMSKNLIDLMNNKLDEIEEAAPGLGVRDYLANLSAGFQETTFDPLDEVWEQEVRRLFNKFDSGETSEN